jgi:hypothetical protein
MNISIATSEECGAHQLAALALTVGASPVTATDWLK